MSNKLEIIDNGFPIENDLGDRTTIIKEVITSELEISSILGVFLQNVTYQRESNFESEFLKGNIKGYISIEEWNNDNDNESFDREIDEIEEEYLDGDIYFQERINNVRPCERSDNNFKSVELFKPEINKNYIPEEKTVPFTIPFIIRLTSNNSVKKILIEYIRAEQKGLQTLEFQIIVTTQVATEKERTVIYKLDDESDTLETELVIEKLLYGNTRIGLVSVKENEEGLEIICATEARVVALCKNGDKNKLVQFRNIQNKRYLTKNKNILNGLNSWFIINNNVELTLLNNNKIMLQADFYIVSCNSEENICDSGLNNNTIIKSSENKQKPKKIYTKLVYVRKGDSLDTIGAKYGVYKEAIMMCNQIRSDYLKPGTIIKVPISY